MGTETEKREWTRIQIYYKTGGPVTIDRESLEEIDKVMPVLTALTRAKRLKEELESILK
ncbi:hypothetical protein ES702_01828 [subsurface metagenome]